VPEVSEKEKARKLVTNMFIAGFFTLWVSHVWKFNY
jgi:hypothetical protein